MAALAMHSSPMIAVGSERESLIGPDQAHLIAGALLGRGYSEGLRAVLSRYVPALYEMPRDRPHLSAAWLMISRRTKAIRVAFATIDTRLSPADALTSSYARV